MTTTQSAAVAAQDIPFNKQRRDWKKMGIIVLFCILPIALLLVFTYLPFFQMCGYSFYKMKYIGTPKFVGMKNFIDIFTRPDLLGTLKLSLYYMVGALVQVALALYLATVLSFKTRGGSFFKGAMFFPYLINGIAIGFIFKFFYTRGYVLDSVLQWCGFAQDQLPFWLKDQKINNWSLVYSSVWRYLGQTMILFIGAIMSIDGSLYEAAEIDGANKWQQFKHIILPGIQTILVLNIILSITGSLSAFEAPYVITSGANGTGTFFVQMDKIAHSDQKVGLASAMAVVLLIIIMICALIQKLVMGYLFRDADDGTAKARKHAKKVEKARKKAMRNANRVSATAAPIIKNGSTVSSND
ncbi:MAG: sugar ABC transporter permease [Bifidobacterium animalis]|uniref:carbohydrate ABC transporter permease n=1 Tax=Bifidobacterium animalis TaxID=28025 RepID=UPI00101F8E60|nr:sugar ABC transporter permease [Bifidobacterium animalis]MCI6533095.1 sugar ABC transporter permease [Bifidobacterium animalis]MDY5039871.1 sugar ABC transporter permease [Bifidobacterium animalis]RYN14317.1 sugar ABC transporter permease [Bifidobacterium animalis subsp. animalis]RYN15273.1 sugar ABC transporter permease [Bifidobacterium animalis subsp. animalis]